MTVEIRTEAFDPYSELQRHAQQWRAGRGRLGATASFVGTMRDVNEGEPVAAMTLEHYPGMTEKHLARIVAEAHRRWDLIDALIIHRVGDCNRAIRSCWWRHARRIGPRRSRPAVI